MRVLILVGLVGASYLIFSLNTAPLQRTELPVTELDHSITEPIPTQRLQSTAKMPRHYTASEIDMMLGTLEKLRDSLGTGQSHPDKDVMRLIGSARRTGPGPRPSPPRPSEAAQVADNIESYAQISRRQRQNKWVS
jgi:hypothetical protein